MADNTKIEWADATVNAVNGCSLVSPGCTNCYAMRLAGTRMKNHPTRAGLTIDTKAGPVWNGKVRLNEAALLQPLSWKRPRRIFWNAHGDLFHPNMPYYWIDKVFAVCAMTPQHTHMILTKRSARMRGYMTDLMRAARIVPGAIATIPQIGRDVMIATADWPLPNVWLGVSVEDQARSDKRIPDLLATPAAVRFLSCEPLLGPVDLTEVCNGHYFQNPLTGRRWHDAPEGVASANDMAGARINWVIVGGESGPGARPMHPDWVRDLRDQCNDAGVAFHFKQWGEFAPGEIAGEYLDPNKRAKGLLYFDGRWRECWSEVEGHRDDEPDVYRVGKKQAGRLLDGVEHSEFPA